MRRYRGPNGDERIWFEPSEIEQIMESELRKAAIMPTAEAPVVDLERFVEQRLRVGLDQYATLDASVLGLTEFFEGKAPRISINKDLTGAAVDDDDSPLGVRGRWRATLAHEAAHVLLHRSLYEFAVDNLSLFASDSNRTETKQLHRCLKRDLSFRRVSDWREVQANQGMAALLMPKSLFAKVARKELETFYPGRDKIPPGDEDRVAQRLAPLFEVSRHATRIRLSTLGFVTPQGQEHL